MLLGFADLVVILADNQKPAALHMSRSGVGHTLLLGQSLISTLQYLVRQAVINPDGLSIMSSKAGGVTEGKGSDLVINAMMRSGQK